MAALTKRRVYLLNLILIAANALPANAEDGIIDEYQVKAAFLYNFAKFVDWPPEAFRGNADPISICTIGKNVFGTSLADAVKDKLVGERSFIIRQLPTVAGAASCHILFVANSERKQLAAILGPLVGSYVLTVGESDDFIAEGGLIHFKLQNSRVRIEINLPAAARAKCRISSKLLSMSEASKK